jgi:type VI secretion system secreted protein VgrG
MNNLPGNEPRFVLSDERFEVLSFGGTEGISTLYAFELDLVSTLPDIAFDSVVGKPTLLTIKGRAGPPRYVHGLVTKLDVVAALPQRTVYRATLAPPHVKLTLRRKTRVFQDLTTQQIVTQVLQEGGVGTGLEWKLRESYKPRNFCVQHRETDMAFVSRLLEEEGIAYVLLGTEEELKTIFCDHVAAYEAIPGDSTVIYNVSTSMVPDQEHVSRFSYGEQLRTGKVHLRDYNFKKPRLLVEGKAAGTDRALEVYDYPGEFVDAELGRRLANAWLEALQGDRAEGTGSSACARLIPGHRFTLGGRLAGERHPLDQLNQEYLLVRVAHNGRQEQVLGEEGTLGATIYSNSFTVVPATARYRPPAVTERPAVRGCYTATVLGPPGEQIYVDPHGRVKVRFHWDRENKSTAWVRVAQSWSGAGFGSQLIPRVGEEVLVSFLAGDPDRPLVTGRVYNGEQRLPYDLPADRTRSTIRSNSSPAGGAASDQSTGLVDPLYANPGFNELRFEDKQGEEEVFLHAQRDYSAVVEHDRATTVGNDRTEEIRHDQTVAVENNEELQVTERSTHRARTLLLHGDVKITFQVGKSRIVLDAAGIRLKTERLVVSGKAVTDIRGGMTKVNCAPPEVPKLPAGSNWIDLLDLFNDGTPVAGATYEVFDADGKTLLAKGKLDGQGKASQVQLPPDKNTVVVRYSDDPQKYEVFRKPKPHGLVAEGDPAEHAAELAQLDDLPD